jgi:hypothetical protein
MMHAGLYLKSRSAIREGELVRPGVERGES